MQKFTLYIFSHMLTTMLLAAVSYTILFPSLTAQGLLAGLDGVVDRLVLLARNLGLEVDVHQLALVRGPLAVRVPVEHNLVAAGISDLGGGMAQRAVGAPLDLVARRLGDEEGLGAALVAVVIEAFLDVVVEDRAVRDGLLCRSAGVGIGGLR